jgi:hypothetical protein
MRQACTLVGETCIVIERARTSRVAYAIGLLTVLGMTSSGSSVALSYNGSRLVASGWLGAGVGDPDKVVYIYTRNESGWQLEEILQPRYLPTSVQARPCRAR